MATLSKSDADAVKKAAIAGGLSSSAGSQIVNASNQGKVINTNTGVTSNYVSPTPPPPVTPPPPANTPTPNTSTPSSTSTPTPSIPKNTTTVGGVDYAAEDRKDFDQLQEEFQKKAASVSETIENISNGSTPLSEAENAQIAGLKQQFETLINQQVLTNKGASGTASIRGYQTGAAEHSNSFQTNIIGSIVTAGANKVADLQVKEASAVAALTQAFRDNKVSAIKDAFGIYEDAYKERKEALQKTIDDTSKAIKDFQDKQQKVQDEVNSIAVDAIKNGAPADVVSAIQSASSLGEALSYAGDYLQTATGDLGDYLNYKHQAEATGKVAQSYDDWLKAKEVSEDMREVNKAYNSSYASAKGKAAGEAAAYGDVGAPLKPLTEGQAKDFTYGQRGNIAMPTINTNTDSVITMSPTNYALARQAYKTPVLGSYLSPELKKMFAAEENFVTSVLRRESGAQIPPSEYAPQERIYFPLPGDTPEIIMDKQILRESVIGSFTSNVPDYERRVSQTTAGILNDSEKIATQTLTQYTENHPEDADEIEQSIQIMETQLGRPISSVEFLQAFPEYK